MLWGNSKVWPILARLARLLFNVARTVKTILFKGCEHTKLLSCVKSPEVSCGWVLLMLDSLLLSLPWISSPSWPRRLCADSSIFTVRNVDNLRKQLQLHFTEIYKRPGPWACSRQCSSQLWLYLWHSAKPWWAGWSLHGFHLNHIPSVHTILNPFTLKSALFGTEIFFFSFPNVRDHTVGLKHCHSCFVKVCIALRLPLPTPPHKWICFLWFLLIKCNLDTKRILFLK